VLLALLAGLLLVAACYKGETSGDSPQKQPPEASDGWVNPHPRSSGR